jgi:amino acid transporter
MEYQNQQRDIFNRGQQSLPNATAVLVLGIVSILFCFICGIVGLAISGKDRRLYEQNPEMYTSSSYDMLKAGRICSIIGLCLWGVVLIFYMFVIVTIVSSRTVNGDF